MNKQPRTPKQLNACHFNWVNGFVFKELSVAGIGSRFPVSEETRELIEQHNRNLAKLRFQFREDFWAAQKKL